MSDSDGAFIGNVTRDPEIKVFEKEGAKSTTIAKFGLAINRRRFNQDTKDWEDQPPTFVDVVCFNGYGENVVASLKKGDRVLVLGELRVRDYEKKDSDGKETGEKGKSVEVIAQEVGVSLKWATAEITKNEKRSGGTIREEDYLS